MSVLPKAKDVYDDDDESPFIHDGIQNLSRPGACMHTANHPESDTQRDHFSVNQGSSPRITAAIHVTADINQH